MKEITDMIGKMKNEKEKLDFFDINSWMPINNQKALKYINTREEFIDRLSSQGIRRAIVSNERSCTCSPFVGNQELVSWVGGCENLYAGAVLAPEVGYAPHELHNYIDELIEQKAILIRMFPKKLSHSLRKWQMGDILSYLEYKKLPLMLWHTETDWDTISEICLEYPGLSIIIEGNERKLLYHNRSYLQLLKLYKNLYIETHNLVQYLGFEYITGQLSIDRLIFGTYFPFNDPNSAILPVITSDIRDDVRYKIASGNIQNLISNIRRD